MLTINQMNANMGDQRLKDIKGVYIYIYDIHTQGEADKEKGATNLHVPLFLNKDTLSGLSKNSNPEQNIPVRAGPV